MMKTRCRLARTKDTKSSCFGDEEGKLNLSVLDIKGNYCALVNSLLLQITKGNRPSFIKAAKPDKAVPLFEYFKEEMAKSGLKLRVESLVPI